MKEPAKTTAVDDARNLQASARSNEMETHIPERWKECHALGVVCVHSRQLIEELGAAEAQLSEQRTTIERLEQDKKNMESECNAFERAERHWRELAGSRQVHIAQIEQDRLKLEGELRLLADWFEDQPNDKDGGVSALQCIEKLRALATITAKPEEKTDAK